MRRQAGARGVLDSWDRRQVAAREPAGWARLAPSGRHCSRAAGIEAQMRNWCAGSLGDPPPSRHRSRAPGEEGMGAARPDLPSHWRDGPGRDSLLGAPWSNARDGASPILWAGTSYCGGREAAVEPVVRDANMFHRRRHTCTPCVRACSGRHEERLRRAERMRDRAAGTGGETCSRATTTLRLGRGRALSASRRGPRSRDS